MARNPSHTNIPEIGISSRIPQIRAAKQSKIAKPSGTVGSKLSTLPKSLSNEKICQASSLVHNTTKTLFKSRFGKPPDPELRPKMNPQPRQPAPVSDTSSSTKDSTFAISRPALKRSDTFDKSEPSVVPQAVDVGNNLTQNVMSKLQEQTFTTSNPSIRMSISPIAPSSAQFAVPRTITKVKKVVAAQISSTPFRETPIANYSTKYLCNEKPLPPISFDITGTDPTEFSQTTQDKSPATNQSDFIADTTEPSFLCQANLSPFDNTATCSTPSVINRKNNQLGSLLDATCDNIADTTEPSFFRKSTPAVPLPSLEKLHDLAENLRDDNLLVDTTMNISKTDLNSTVTVSSNERINDTDNDESTIKSTTMLLCLGDESRHENTLVPLVPDHAEVMEIDDRGNMASSADVTGASSTPIDMPNKQRFSFGQDITEWTLDCSIELYDSSVGSSAANVGSPSHMKKQHSFDEKSLSILTPDQMKEFLDSNNTNLNLDLPLFPKMPMHQCRIDQTPSPEELPLDPIGVKTDVSDMSTVTDNQMNNGQYVHEQQLSQTDSYSKTDQMTKSAASKVSNSFITSVTSITSLDTGYQGDGEMSRPASRGGDHSPSNMHGIHSMRPIGGREPLLMNNNQNNIAIVRRQDPMTDSDFFTESDADDIVNRGDRRAQVIDGQLYGAPMVQDANVNHYVNQQPSTEDSCMESSGIFTDAENRGDDELHRSAMDSDMSPDGSTDTIKSSNTEYNNKKNSTVIEAHTDTFVNNHQGHSMSDSTTSTINSGCEKEQKHNKNEANVALKKHEMSKSKRLSGEKIKNASSSGVLSSVGDIENQENKRPVTSGSARKVVPNKWDAVMNKIASNKTSVKSKNYNEVKSKVTCGLTKKSSPGVFKSPTVEDDVFVATSKRNYSLSSKRGRTHSQQSSQSDISENVGSSITKLRANSTSTPQKRFSNGSSSAVSSSPTEQKSSPPPKKFLSKRSAQSASSKTPLKDHNRLVGSGTPTTTTTPPPPTTILQATSRKIDTSPRGTISPKTTKRVLLSHTSPHSIQNATHHTNNIVQNDRIFNSRAHASQIERIVNNGKIDNCLNGTTPSVITATIATSTIDVVDPNLIRANKGVAALGVLVKYLVDDLDAFSIPHLKKTNESLSKMLMDTKVQLENARLCCSQLEDQMAEKNAFFSNREKEIEDHYNGELIKVENRFTDLDQSTKARIALLEEKLQNTTNHFQTSLAEKDEELVLAKNNADELSKRIKDLSSTENELREKVLASETEFSERLQASAMRERELTEKFSVLSKDLTEKLSSANNEIMVLRSTVAAKVPPSPKVSKEQPITFENEIQSWRSVLEMKQKEISDLKMQNLTLENNAAALPGALTKIAVLESRLEDLTIQLKIKTDEEQDLLQKNRQLEQSYKQEVKNRSVVSLDNEQLKYRLKTNTEKFSSAIIELAKSQTESSMLSDLSITLNGSDNVFGNDTSSPPSTPVVKGVVEKTASVSYVLEINDEESPEALASRIIRRAGSFRQNDRNRLVQQGNALTQSASATSILRQHSESGTPRSHLNTIRNRSKSVSTNSTNTPSLQDDKQSTVNSKLNVPQWKTPLCSSSPNSKRTIQAANNSKDNDVLLSEEESETECVRPSNAEKGQYFRRSNSYKHTKRGLITCNTAALTSQRPDLCLSLPMHPTVKELKKFQQIKESAGEAMVSGTNSEDEASTASSDGSLSSRSSSSGRRRSSLEDANIEKIVASLGANNEPATGLVGTPMEVSWSDDVDHFASDSAV
ncbi:uncharacterized protein LOC119076360 isoform X2 [Bradysia coprophila]|uniref:uncharacterized protein LOC119076360 isoform X2 n=1 Tax=Bradysia coprophila TaxID=38358 RepID=UPI00187DA065|nr:uncharacterized protein LOC119076360 isoform X2 [Bradysia coprophila]